MDSLQFLLLFPEILAETPRGVPALKDRESPRGTRIHRTQGAKILKLISADRRSFLMEAGGYPEVRDDIFLVPDLPPFTRETIRTAMILVYGNRALDLFKNEMPTRSSVVSYLNSFRNPTDAEEFLSLSSFIYMARKSVPSPVGLIMLISVAEELAAPSYLRKHLQLQNWLEGEEVCNILQQERLLPIGNNEGWKKATSMLCPVYFERHGSRRAFRRFLEDNLTRDQKLEIIRSIRTKQDASLERHYTDDLTLERMTKVLPFDHLVPGCFVYESCWTGYEYCLAPDCCRLRTSQPDLDCEFRRAIDQLYEARNRFVHAAISDISLPKRDQTPTGILSIIQDREGKWAAIGIGLSYERFEQFILEAMKRHFDRLR
jgi:hypothetical protein